MRVDPFAPLPKGATVRHIEHGLCTLIKRGKKKDGPYCVWVKMGDIKGTVDIRLLEWPDST